MAKNAYIGGSVNLVNAANPLKISGSNGHLTLSNNQLIVNYTADSGCYFYLMLAQPLIANKTYVLSFDCSGVEEGVLSEWRVENNVNYSIILQNGRLSIPFSLSTDIPTQLLMDDGNRANVVGKEIILSNFFIEDTEADGVASGVERAYLGVAENLINTNTSFSIINNGNISVRDKQTIVLNYAVAKDTYFFIPLTQTLVTGKSYTVSFDCSGIDDSMVLTILIDNQVSNPMRLENGRLSRSFTPYRDVVGRLLMDDTAPWTNVIGKEIVLSNFLIEEDGASGVARKIRKIYGGDENGIARLLYERNYYFIPSDADELVAADNKTFCIRGD